MPSKCLKTIKKLALKFLLLAGVLALLDIVYLYTLYPKDLEANCTLMQRSMMPVEQHADVVYLGESSNHAVADDEEDKRFISDMLQDLLPDHRIANLDKDACHAGIYYDILRNIPAESPVKTAIVTVNMRSFTAEWIYSSLEVPLRKEQVLMKKAPALYKRMLLAFKGYTHWTDEENAKIVRNALRKQKINYPGVQWKTASEWDKAVADQMYARGVSDDTISLATHYVKCFACDVDEDNPRIRDLDRIAKLCRQRGWHAVFHILPDNEDQMAALVGPELVDILRRNGQFVEQRYKAMGVTVVNNQGTVRDADFRDRDFPTEHYRQNGRQTIATAIAKQIFFTNSVKSNIFS